MSAEQFGGIVRAVVSAAGGYFVGRGLIDQETAVAVAGAFATVAVAIWSVAAKRKK